MKLCPRCGLCPVGELEEMVELVQGCPKCRKCKRIKYTPCKKGCYRGEEELDTLLQTGALPPCRCPKVVHLKPKIMKLCPRCGPCPVGELEEMVELVQGCPKCRKCKRIKYTPCKKGCYRGEEELDTFLQTGALPPCRCPQKRKIEIRKIAPRRVQRRVY